jgi:hypothetical protein
MAPAATYRAAGIGTRSRQNQSKSWEIAKADI